jgi:hypothetical protein
VDPDCHRQRRLQRITAHHALLARVAGGLEGKKAEMVERIGRIAELHEAREKVSGWALGGWPLGGAVVRADEKGKASSRFLQLLHPCIFGRLSCYVCLPACLPACLPD